MIVENITFGNRGFSLKSLNIGTEYFVGANASTNSGVADIVKTTAAAAGGLDFGSDNGNYRHQLFVDVKATEKLADTAVSSVTFKIYDSSDNSSFVERTSVTVDKEQLNDTLKREAVRFNVVSTAKRYFLLGVTVNGTGTAALTSGALVAMANTPTW